jgi:hypothetical protein
VIGPSGITQESLPWWFSVSLCLPIHGNCWGDALDWV